MIIYQYISKNITYLTPVRATKYKKKKEKNIYSIDI